MNVEALKLPQLTILRGHRIPRLAQERLKIHDVLFPVVEDKEQLVAGHVYCVGDFEILSLISTGL